MSDINNDNTETASEENNQSTAAARAADLPDNAHDEERMQPEEIILDLPDVSDIPGQETVHVPSLGELADTTISSDDEEGVGIFGDDDVDEDTELIMGTDADVSEDEQGLLAKAEDDMPTDDDTHLRSAELDNIDLEGEALNEGSTASNISGADLDTSGVDSDDPMEAIGEEDEENNTYSLGSDSNDNVTEGTP